MVNHVGIYLDLRWPRVYRRSNIRTYKRKYWFYLSLPIYWSTGVFFASKYFSKTDKLCEKFNPVACFTHALPDHRQQHPNEFFSPIYWDWWNNDNDENKQMNNNLNISAVEISKTKTKNGCFHLLPMHTFLIILPSSSILVKLPNLLRG